MVHLNELHDTYADKGFQVLAVTNEERGLVDEFVSAQSATYPIVIEASDSAQAFGAGGFPSSFLIAPDGTIAWSGHPASVPEDLIEELLTKVELFPDLPSKFSSVRRLMEKGKLAEAESALAKMHEGSGFDETEDGPWGEKLAAWLAWNKEAALARIRKATEASDWFKVWKTWTDVEKAWKGTDLEDQAGAELKALLADHDKKAEVDAGRKLDSILRRIRGMSPKKAIGQLESMTSKRYADTLAGRRAAEMIAKFEKEIEALK